MIITADPFSEEVLPLAEWKEKKGFKAYVAAMSELLPPGTPPDEQSGHVAEFISNAYHTGPKTSYVLLVGDYLDPEDPQAWGVPAVGGGAPAYPVSDVCYTFLEGDDFLPDVTLGRLPVQTELEATNVLNKIVAYDRSPDNGDWYDDSLIAAFFQDQNADGEADVWFMETAMHVNGYLADVQGMETHTALCADEMEPPPDHYYYYNGPYDYPHRISDPSGNEPPYAVPAEVVDLWTDEATATGNITTAINAGVGLVQHRDHGEWNRWVHPYFDVDDVAALANGAMTPAVFSICCMTGAFGYKDDETGEPHDCFAEALLKHSDGGAVGVMAASTYSYSGFNDLLTHGLYTCFWPDYDPTHTGNAYPHSMRPAEAMDFGKYYMCSYYDEQSDPFGAVRRLHVEMYHWFGDPEMMLRTETPEPLTVTWPASVTVGEPTDVTVTVEDTGPFPVEGATVCISKGDCVDYWVGTTGANGQVTFEGLTTHEVGDYDIVVTAFDALPYEGTVVSNCSPSVLVVDATPINGRNDGQPDTFLIERDGGDVKVYLNDNPDPSYSVPFDQLDLIIVNGSLDDDEVVVELAYGNVIPDDGIWYSGLGEVSTGDLLVVENDTFAAATCSLTDLEAGEVLLDGRRIDFFDLEALGDTSPVALLPSALGTLEINLSDGVRHYVELFGGECDPVHEAQRVTIEGLFGWDSTFSWPPDVTFTLPTELLSVNLGVADDLIACDAVFDCDVQFNNAGGSDRAELLDSDANDTYIGYPTSATLTSGGGTLSVNNFAEFRADMGLNLSDFDTAHLSGSIGNDHLSWEWSEGGYFVWLDTPGGTDYEIEAIRFNQFYIHASGGEDTEEGGGGVPDCITFVGLFWDEQGDGQWDYIDPGTGYSRWVDWDGNPVTVYPDDELTDAVIKTDAVTLTGDCSARDVTVESGNLAIPAATTLDAAGRFEMGEAAEYACQIGGGENGLVGGKVEATGDVHLAGTLSLDPTSRYVEDGKTEHSSYWVGTLAIITAGDEVDGTFDTEPPSGDYLGWGVFLTSAVGYSTDAVEVDLFQALGGDTDADGDVDPTDLSTLVQNWAPNGTDKTWREGNFDDWQDGNVDPSDLSILVQNWSPAGYVQGGEGRGGGEYLLLMAYLQLHLTPTGWLYDYWFERISELESAWQEDFYNIGTPGWEAEGGLPSAEDVLKCQALIAAYLE